MQGKVAYNRPLWSDPFPDLVHSGSFSAQGWPILFMLSCQGALKSQELSV